jgi:hypothetical protein
LHNDTGTAWSQPKFGADRRLAELHSRGVQYSFFASCRVTELKYIMAVCIAIYLTIKIKQKKCHVLIYCGYTAPIYVPILIDHNRMDSK